MKDFQDLLALALVGTSRGPLPQHAGSPLADTLNAVQGDPEGTLLSRAALAGLVRQAGQVAAPLTVDVPAPAPTETLPAAPPTFARHLSLVLNTPLLSEWLRLCARGGWRVPPETLPALLDLARFDVELRGLLRPVLGERGAWVSQFNPEWRFTPAAFSDAAWENASEAQKESLYESLRHSDPAASREFLTQTFKGEKAGTRTRLLRVLQATWTDADTALEPLLEAALTDRSGEVQEQARWLLQQWTQSAYNARMSERAAQLIRHDEAGLPGKLRSQDRYSLHLPSPDPDLKRDGFDEKPSAQTYLSHIVSRTHPDTLMSALGVSPVKLVVLAKTFEVLDELERTTRRFSHVALAEALLNIRKNDLRLRQIVGHQNLLPTLWDALKRDDLELLSVLIHELPTPWPADLSSAILSALRDSLRNVGNAYVWYPRWRNNLYPKALTHAHPEATLPAPLPEAAPEFARQILQELTATLEQRRQMHRDFEEARG